MKFATAIKAIEKHGILLVFPIKNSPEPRSLWSVAYPKSPMRWEWDESGDNRVGKLWHLREKLSSSGQAVYTKWYQGRATFFSREVFTAMLAGVDAHRPTRHLGRDARRVLEALEMDSPLSTKVLKAATELAGKLNEPSYERALRELWRNLLIVSYGEVDEGAFPSLALGATRLLFEDLWKASSELPRASAEKILRDKLGAESLFFRWYQKTYGGTDAKHPAAY